MKTKTLVSLIALLDFALAATAQTSSIFTYQGRLEIGGGSPNPSNLFDYRFTLFDAPTGGVAAAAVVQPTNVPVTDGLFTVSLDFGSNVFNGTPRWLQIEVRPATNDPAAPYEMLSPRQLITPTPQSFFAEKSGIAENLAPAASLNLTGPVQFNPTVGPPFMVGNTQRVTNLNADLLDGLDAAAFWRRDTNGVVSSIVAPDDRPIEIRTEHNRLLRLEPTGSDSPNVIAGASVNVAGSGVEGAVIAGGGAGNYAGLAITNRADADFGVVGGGAGNQIAAESIYSGIFAGLRHAVWSNSPYAGVLLGRQNSVLENSQFAAVLAGERNTIGPQANHAAILSGANNRIEPGASVSVIASGSGCVIHSNGIKSAIVSGTFNEIHHDANHSFLGGGLSNQIGSGTFHAFLGGGLQNQVGPMSAQSFIGGGSHNTIESNAQLSAILAGGYNLVRSNATYGTVMGGLSSVAGAPFSMAAGHQAKAEHSGSIVLADGQYADFSSSNVNEFAVRAAGGVRFVTGGSGLSVDGVQIANGNGLRLPAGAVATSNLVDGAVLAEILDNDGAGSGLDADRLDGFSSEDFWKLTGNAGTTPDANFLGTRDLQALDFRVNNVRALRLEPSTSTPNVIGGHSGNQVNAFASGVVIGGGGAEVFPHTVSAHYGVIGGGRDNSIANGSSSATISGGDANHIGTNAPGGAIGGGTSNGIARDSASATVAGGHYNEIAASSSYATIAGGFYNDVAANSENSTVGGGADNNIGAGSLAATISGGGYHDIGTNSGYSTIAGGDDNNIGADSDSATISGGSFNNIGTNADRSTVAGGYSHSIADNAGYASIGGGYANTIGTNADYAMIPGGRYANASHYGQLAQASGRFATSGDAQTSVYVLRRTTINATQSELFLDGVSQRMTVPANSVWAFDVLIAARSTAGDSAAFRFVGAVKDLGTGLELPAPSSEVLMRDVPAWQADISISGSALLIRVTGSAGATIRWVATVRTVEVIN